MRVEGTAFQLRVELDPDEPGMVGPLDDLRQAPVGRHSGENEAGLLQRRHVAGIDLVAVAVALADPGGAVDCGDLAVAAELGFIGAEAHGPAKVAVGAAFLQAFGAHPFGDEADDGLFRSAEFRARGVRYAGLADALDAGHLHAEADPEEGDFALAGEFDRGDLALASALAEASGDEDPVQGLELGGEVRIRLLEHLRIEPADMDPGAVGQPAVDERLVEALVGVRKADIFADDSDRHLALVIVEPVHDVGPAREIGLRRVAHPEDAEHLSIEAGRVILERDIVDRPGVERRDDRRFRHVAEQCDLFALALGKLAVRPAEKDVGLHPEAGKLANAVLGRLGLQFSSGLDPGYEGGVDADGILAPEVVSKLADGLDERKRFDVADGAADLTDDEVDIVGIGEREFLDRVGDVRNDLDGGSEIIAAPLAGDDVPVDSPGGDVVGLARGNAGEALVMAEVEVGLGSVVGHEDLAMLVWRHRSWIDVQIGIEFPDSDGVSTRLEKRSE